MPWLLRDGDVLASLEVPDGHWGRARGLLGRDDIEGAMLLRPARAVHTLGMRFAIDVAYLDADLCVLEVKKMRRWRMGRPRRRAHAVVEASAGAFARWGLAVGDELEISGG